MNIPNFGLVKQNTCYEIQFQRKNPTFSPYVPGYRRIRPSSNASRDRLVSVGSRILSVGRGDVTVKVEDETKTSTAGSDPLPQSGSMSADNIHESTPKSTPSKSLVPVLQSSRGMSKTNVLKTTEDAISKQFSIVSKSLDLRGSPESMRQLRNYIKSITNTQLGSFRDELNKITEQNKCLREELTLHSDTISKLLDMTTEKNNLIAEIKCRNSRLEQEIRIKNEINENFVSLLKEVDDLKKKCVTNDEEKIKYFVKSYLKSRKDNNRAKKSSNSEVASEATSSTALSGVTSFSQMSNCSDLLSEIHTHKSQESVDVVTQGMTMTKVQNQEPAKVASLQKFADSMEVLSSRRRRIDFRKIFCCKPV